MEQENEKLQNEGLEQKLSAMLSDPESMSRLAGMASALASSGALSGLLGAVQPVGADGAEASEERLPASVSAPTDGKSGAGMDFKSAGNRHSALLRALKPYLGQEKQARIDQMMRLLQLAELADTVLRGK